MKILEYIDLDTSRVAPAYARITEAIARGDFHAAQVKKLSSVSHGTFYRARLNDADRLLFSMIRHGDETCALMLEVIANHDYDGSRFLRGAAIDEAKIPDCDAAEASNEARPVRYLHPRRVDIHLLDKPISFDDAQQSVYQLPPPLIVVGSAGSGKTALTLEKLKHAEGEVLYVTQSAYLARSARDLYYANGFENPGQDATFLSYREFVESIRVPAGREASWRGFSGWFARMRQAFRGIDGHQAFEEIRGVIAAAADGALSREAYRQLGVRQSIFPPERRDALYDLFEKYRAWLADAGLFDINLVAQQWQALAAPRYDFLVVDEVQDLTNAQLALLLKTLKKPTHFLLCGDSNQVVHPNFFSWARVKSLFWHDPVVAERQELRVLSANFRNAKEATRVANQLLKIKQRRFGSIDRESNFLVDAVGAADGEVVLLSDKEGVRNDLDRRIRQSTRFAVLVMRDEDKAEARRHFATPLLFSIHEAKGLEYENIVLFRFVSDHRAEFAGIAEGVVPEDLLADALDYRRAKEKSDRSLEIYKFFVNALYVALTRATQNVYLVESDHAHPLFGLLDPARTDRVAGDVGRSSIEDWQKEARKLELQGKQEQADAIRETILKQTPVPWPVFDENAVTALLLAVFREQAPGGRKRQQLYDFALCHDMPVLATSLAQEARFDTARAFAQQRPAQARKTWVPYFASHFKDILRQCERHGVEHRLPMNMTPLMAAAAAGNGPLVEALLERGADREAIDDFGCNALHWAMREAFREPKYARGPFAGLYELLAPASVDLRAGERLVRLDRHIAEYFVFQTLWALFQSRFTHRQRRPHAAFDTQSILDAWQHLPTNVVRPERNKRQHLSSVLSRNEVEREYAYNRALFVRVAQGWYQFDPALAVRRAQGDTGVWVPVYQALNLPFIGEFAQDSVRGRIDEYLQRSGMPERTIPVAAERAIARREAAQREQERHEAEIRARIDETRARIDETRARIERESQQRLAANRIAEEPPKWGTPEARRLEIERIRREIEERRKG